MKTMKCLIVDDEELARNLVENYISRIPHLETVAKCGDPLEAMSVLHSVNIDIMFLDIQMPELSGLEFLRTLSIKPIVIITTAYKEHALEGFDLDVADYLLKPFRFNRFLQAVNKAGNLVGKEEKQATALAGQELNQSNDYLLVKSDFKLFKILYCDIHYIEGMKEYVAFHTNEGRLLSLDSLKRLETELPSDSFMRIHKSYIANTSRIKTLEGNMVHLEGKKLPIGSSYREAVLKKVF